MPNTKLSVVTFLLFIFISNSSFSQEYNSEYEKSLSAFEDQDYPTAVIHLKNTLKETPSYLPAHILYAKMLLAFRKGGGAEISLEKAVSLGADLNAIAPLMAEALLLQQKFREVLEYTNRGNRVKVIETKLSYFRGQAYLGLKKFVPAEESFDYALSLTPNHSDSLVGKAQVYMAHKLNDKAAYYADKALESFNPNANAWLVRARLYVINQQPQKALDLINTSLKENQRNISIRYLKTEILLSQSKYSLAEEEINKILDQAPKEPKTNFLKSILESEMGKLQEAATTANTVAEVLSVLPEDILKTTPRYLYIAGYIKFQQKAYEEARTFLTQYAEVDSNFRVSLMLAKTHIALGDYANAHYLLKKINREAPQNLEVLVLMGRTSLLKGNNEEAQRYLIQALQLESNSVEALVYYAQSYINQEKFIPAIEILNKVSSAYPNHIQILSLLNVCYVQMENYELAKQTTTKLVAAKPDDLSLNLLNARNYLLSKDWEEANKLYKQIEKAYPLNLEPLIGQIDVLVAQGYHSSAINKLNEIYSTTKNSPLVLKSFASAYRKERNFKQELFWLEKAFSVNNKQKDILEDLVIALNRGGAPTLAIDRVKTALATSPEPYELELLAELYLQQKDYSSSVAAYQKLIEVAPDRGRGYLALANAQTISKDTDGAISSLRKALAWNDDLIDANIGLFKLLLVKDEHEQAQLIVDSIRAKSTGLPMAELLQGDLFYDRKNFALAATHYHLALEIQTTDQGVLSLYRTYKKLGKYEEIESILSKWISSGRPKNLRAVIALADIYELNGKKQEVRKLYEQTLENHPNSPVILNNYANLLAKVEDIAEATIIAKRAFDLLPNNPTIIDTYAWIKILEDENELALSLLRKAQAIDYENYSVKYHIALALNNLGRKAPAKRALAELLESNQEFKEVNEAKALYKTLKVVDE